MANDHYVAQTYLKHFAGPNGMLRAYRKADGKTFTCPPKDVCHEWNGDIIENFHSDPQKLANYRKLIEPKWNPAIADLQAGKLPPESKLAIAAYWSNLLTFTPAGRRLDVGSYNRDMVDHLRARNTLQIEAGEPDEKLRRLLETLDANNYRVEIDPNYTRATRVGHLLEYTWLIYNADWTVLKSESETEFLTSDNPIAFEDPGPWQRLRAGLPRFFPVTPCLCIYGDLKPNAALESWQPDFSPPPKGTDSFGVIPDYEVRRINRAIVQCAESLVFSSEARPRIQALVSKYSRHRIEMDFIRMRQEGQFILGQAMRVRARTDGWDASRGPPETAALGRM